VGAQPPLGRGVRVRKKRVRDRAREQWTEIDPVLERWESNPDDLPVPEWAEGRALVNPEESLSLYSLGEASSWSTLAVQGGWLDQPDWFIHDVLLLMARSNYLKRTKGRREELKKTAEDELSGRVPPGTLDRLLRRKRAR
jgi:hypothetical protein